MTNVKLTYDESVMLNILAQEFPDSSQEDILEGVSKMMQNGGKLEEYLKKESEE